jgi:hypothetical protein
VHHSQRNVYHDSCSEAASKTTKSVGYLHADCFDYLIDAIKATG